MPRHSSRGRSPHRKNLTEVPGLRSLFSLGKPDALRETFRASGFTDVASHTVPTRAIFSSAAEAVRITLDSFPGLRASDGPA